jgi:hypothetical protein
MHAHLPRALEGNPQRLVLWPVPSSRHLLGGSCTNVEAQQYRMRLLHPAQLHNLITPLQITSVRIPDMSITWNVSIAQG